jgi:hypothetical protein
MVSVNPQHDAYGFQHWKKPGALAEHYSTGSLGRFEGFLAALWALLNARLYDSSSIQRRGKPLAHSKSLLVHAWCAPLH